jgi:hypothetical protein
MHSILLSAAVSVGYGCGHRSCRQSNSTVDALRPKLLLGECYLSFRENVVGGGMIANDERQLYEQVPDLPTY